MCGECAFYLGAAEGTLDYFMVDIKDRLVNGNEVIVKLQEVRDLIQKAFNAEEASYGKNRTIQSL